MRIDLHTHSSRSDGTDDPADLVRIAADAGIDVLALTDHDTTAGWAEATKAKPDGLRLVRGAELSCVSPDGRGGRVSVHLLAYLFDPEHAAVVTEQTRLRAERRVRLVKMVTRMAEDGYPVDPATFLDRFPPDLPAGRPHLARALVDEGVVGSVNEAFQSLLNNSSRYYLPRADTPVDAAIEMITSAGGVCVFAHPLARRRGRVVELSVIADLAGAGLAGVEVDHPDHDAPDRATLRGLAAELGLVATGSSDYHGTNKTTPIAAETTDPEMFERLVAGATAIEVLD
ncbi:MAG: 3,5-nucleoside bisphosphate phosphatase [Pseudonocardiales bacterium]|nr:3,5-nucleoside bisphosphate phosphatase [Pseudonocardiales bacterium]MDT7583366.1 3,5-nucleoside bisphosphate phosphatase [Pseudonocardiales bacterium]MDT7624377.1 3,5-nucleoside bisphosphate phosphatase [Pseudonocardiales bacterium]MDT7634350.1 3,5-nucleoside bisphosphate phosphatase [Pseudonocardiales bacterium]MDT7642374.1 3,5-nucleoside bisphosphate phosphatase [Pseudonocardiales bacterium]